MCLAKAVISDEINRPTARTRLSYPSLAGQRREHAAEVRVGVPNPPGARVELQQILCHDQAQQLGIYQPGFAAPDMGSGQADPGHDPITEEDIKCGPDGVELIDQTEGSTSTAINY